MLELLESLNPQQREAVVETDGPLLILAGAGSGKTRVITFRIAYLIAERGVAPHNILAVTFTNKAAQEMRNRVEQLLKGRMMGSAPLISTFHSLCVRILRQEIEKLQEGYTRSFTIYDQDDSVRLVKACIKDLGYDEKQLGQRARIVVRMRRLTLRASNTATKNARPSRASFASTKSGSSTTTLWTLTTS
jgi:DNA helicase-2/ATP-dependent DNA helicase PcrA